MESNTAHGAGQQNICPDAADTLTILHHPTIALTKTWTRTAQGWDKQGHPKTKMYCRVEEVALSSFDDLADALRREEASTRSHPVRGAFNHGHAYPHKFRREFKNNNTFVAAQSHRWQHFDIDTLKCPGYLKGDRNAQLEYALDQIAIAFPPLKGMTCFFQWSSSAGVVEGVIKLHVWFFLASHVDEEDMREYIVERNAAYASGFSHRLTASPRPGFVDTAIYNRVQIHYTTPPIFTNCKDPLEAEGVERSGVRRGCVDEPDLAPEIAQVRARRVEMERTAERRKREARELAEYNKRNRPPLESGNLEALAQRIWDDALDEQRLATGSGTRTPQLFATANAGAELVKGGYLNEHTVKNELKDVFVMNYPENPTDAARQVDNVWKIAMNKVDAIVLRGPRDQQRPDRSAPRPPQPPPLEDADAPMWMQDDDNATIEDNVLACAPNPSSEPPTPPGLPDRPLSIEMLFERLPREIKRLLNTPGHHAVSAPPGGGKNHSVIEAFRSDPDMLRDALILEPTVAKRVEMTSDLRRAGLPVRQAVTRTRQNCDRIADIMRAGEIHPEGSSKVCTACEQNPQSPFFGGSMCTYLKERAENPGITVLTHAHGAGVLNDPEATKPRVVIVDEATKVESGDISVDIYGLMELKRAGDVQFPPAVWEKIEGILLNSLKDPKDPTRPQWIKSKQIADIMGKERPFVPAKQYNAGVDALDQALWHGIQHGIIGHPALKHTPAWKVLVGLEHVEQYGWDGVYAYNGDMYFQWFQPLNLDGVETVLRLDATITENMWIAGGGNGEHLHCEVETPEHFELVRVNESMGKGSTHSRMLSERKLKVWRAAHIEGDGPHRLHVTHKAWSVEGHPMYEHVSQLIGPVIWYGGDEARGSNRYKGLTEAVLDSWHVPRRAVASMAYRIKHLTSLRGIELSDDEALEEAHWALHPAEFIQTVERLRGIQATADRKVRVTLLDTRTMETAERRYEESSVVVEPGIYTFLQTLKTTRTILDEQCADTLIKAHLDAQDGVSVPGWFFARPNSVNLTDLSKDENLDVVGVGQPFRKSPYICIGDISVRLTNTDYDEIRSRKRETWEHTSKNPDWNVSKISTGNGVYALLHTRPYTPDDIRACVQSAGAGWTVASVNGQRMRLDDWADRFDSVASGLPTDSHTWSKGLLGEWLAHHLGESVATLRRNLKATGRTWDSALALSLAPPPSPEPVEVPREEEPPSAPEQIETVGVPEAVESVEENEEPARLVKGLDGLKQRAFARCEAQHMWSSREDLRARYVELRRELPNTDHAHREAIRAEMWGVVVLGSLDAGECMERAVEKADAAV